MIIELEKEILSAEGNKIQLLKAESISSIDSVVLIIGVFHGDEPEGEFLINNLIKDIKETPEIIENKKVLFIPCLNPDGKNKNTRGNSNGIDLNRNFPTQNRRQCDQKGEFNCGENPASEIETKFIMEIL